jgi:hypothetical protein
MPWLSWQVFRRTRALLVQEFGMQFQQTLAMAITMKPDSLEISAITNAPEPKHR